MKAVALFILLLSLVVGNARAQDFGDLAGTLDVSHVDADVDGRDDESWRQLYTLNWTKRATDYIDFRLGLRYYDFDLDSAEEIFGTFQEEFQPTGELSWRHPWFHFTGTATRRISRSPAISGDLINDSVLLNWESAWMETPTFGLRYEMQDAEETGPDALRGVKSRRLTASVDHRLERESFNYRIGRIWTDNVIQGITSDELEQQFQYLGGHTFGDRRQYQLSSQYRYSRVDLSSEVKTGDRFLERVDPAQGLGGVDTTPDQGPLSVVPGLIDGNTLAPVVPPLSIGAGDTDRNIGVDLGVRRDRVSALYVYTDRLSAATVQWRVWISDDNLNWTDSATPSVATRFNTTLLRYEIEFNAVAARFVKVVNSGTNAIVGVQVTEVEVFESLADTDEVERDASSHLADARLIWTVNRKWQLSADGVARLDPVTGTLGQRFDYSYGLRARYQPRIGLAHVFRWAQSWREFEDDTRDARDDTGGYSLLYDPLPTLGGTLSGSFRQSYEGGGVIQRSGSALVGANAEPYRAIRASAEFGVSRVDQPEIGLLTDSWNTRWTIDTEITSRLSFTGIWLHQESKRDLDDGIRVLRRVTMSGELQVTSSLFGRASLTYSEDQNIFRRQEYLLSWRLFTDLVVTGQAFITDGNTNSNTQRYSANANLDLFDRFLIFRNVTLYVRFSDVDQREAGGSRILSWQQGLRAAF